MTAQVVAFVFAQVALAFALAWASEVRYRKRVERSHDRERTTWQEQLDALARSIHYGVPSAPEAVVTSPEPSAEERAARAFGQEAIANGVRRLREEYAAVGVHHLDEDALQQEAISILFGSSPVPSIPLLVRDG